MGLFTKKDPATEYETHKKEYLQKQPRQKNDVCLRLYKAEQMGDSARLYVQVTEGCLHLGDLLEIEYTLNNKLGIHNAVAPVQAIYQILGGGFGRQETLAKTDAAYENDLIWVELPGVDVKLMYKNGMIRKSKAKNAPEEAKSEAVSYDEEVSKMVSYFKEELNGYFAGHGAISHITQDLSHSLLAQKKRLDALGITVETEKATDAGSAAMAMEVGRYSSSQYDVAEANEPVKLRRTYRRAGSPIYQDADWRICYYLLAGAKYNNDGLISCPNCGSFAPREALLTGCPYCGTQFRIRDLSLRVAGYAQKKIPETRGRVDVGYVLYHESQHRELDQVLRHRMAAVDPLFSPTAFYNSMRNKLYAVVFAENEGALRNLADEDFDIGPFFGQFQNAIDLDIQGIDTKNFKLSAPYILVDVVMNAMVLRLDDAKQSAAWSKETITMSFVKHMENKTQNIFEPDRIQCRCCGASFSLYEGKACAYCGSEIDYPMYDWLLIDMTVEPQP